MYCTVYSHDSVYAVLVLALLAYATSTSAAYISSSCTPAWHARHSSRSSSALASFSLHPDPEVWVPTTTTTTILHLATRQKRTQAVLRIIVRRYLSLQAILRLAQLPFAAARFFFFAIFRQFFASSLATQRTAISRQFFSTLLSSFSSSLLHRFFVSRLQWLTPSSIR